MREVSKRIVHFATDLAKAGDLDVEALFEGVPSFAKPHPDGVPWDDFVQVWERLEVGCGGPDGFREVAELAMPTAYAEVRIFASVFVSPIALFRFMMLRHLNTSFSNVQVTELEHSSDGHGRWRERISPPHRPCPAYHRTTRTFASLIPLHLGLPAADVKLVMIDERTAELEGYFPPRSRGRSAASSVLKLLAAQLESAYASIGTRVTPRHVANREGQRVGAGWPDKLDLSNRQRDVFVLVVEGRANKEIATVLACTERNVEFHVGRILRAARVTSRAELLVKVLGSGP